MHGEVMVAISNANYAQPGGMLDTWAESVLRAGVKNAMVVALDEATKAHAESKGLPAFQMTLEARALTATLLTCEAHTKRVRQSRVLSCNETHNGCTLGKATLSM